MSPCRDAAPPVMKGDDFSGATLTHSRLASDYRGANRHPLRYTAPGQRVVERPSRSSGQRHSTRCLSASQTIRSFRAPEHPRGQRERPSQHAPRSRL
jgi:hypothetical protein